jgi:5-methyltetrahydrofolate--homocysteine methyltransferase
MKTVITSETKTVTIDTEGQFTIIGEKINPTSRSKLATQLKERNYDHVPGLVKKQAEA